VISVNFFGTHDFAAGILQALIDSADFEIKTVFTVPDKPIGRHQEIQKSSVKILAEKYGLRVEQPESLQNFSLLLTPYSLNIVCDYGLLIPKNIIDAPGHGSLNVHPSLLPKYRGATPVQTALMNGDSETGVTIMLMDEKLDHGPILAWKTIKIDPTDNYTSLSEKLLETAKSLLIDTVQKWVLGPKMPPQPQDDSKATVCHELTRADGQVDFSGQTAQQVYNRFRALTPWPGVWTMLGGKRVKLLSVITAMPTGRQAKAGICGRSRVKPGMTAIADNQIFFTCADGNPIEVLELQMEGKKPMTAKEFINGYKTLLHA